MEPDIQSNRAARKWTRKEQAGRTLWIVSQPLFALSPRPCWGWRRFLLRLFGARIGKQVRIAQSARISIPWNIEIADEAAIGDQAILYSLGLISIGRRTTVSQNVHLCAGTHDYQDPSMPLIKSPIVIGNGVWICADAFIGPGVNIGDSSIVAARAVAVKNVPREAIVAGNPARMIKVRKWRCVPMKRQP